MKTAYNKTYTQCGLTRQTKGPVLLARQSSALTFLLNKYKKTKGIQMVIKVYHYYNIA